MTHAPAPSQPQMQPPAQFVKAPSNGLATASLVLGIIGTVLALIPFLGILGAVIGGLGLILGIFGFLASRKHGVGTGKSIAGLVLGVASIVVFALVSAATVAAVDTAVKETNKTFKDATDTSAATDLSNKSELKDATVGAVSKGAFGDVTVKITVTNHSSKTSDYMSTVVFESPNGKKQYGTGDLFIDHLRPGQTKVNKVGMLDELPHNATRVSVRLTDFDRSASY
ncbi:MAG: DUF4190 domain-containing protein [Nocardioidaceae bacterium]